MLLVILAFILFIPVGLEYIKTGLVPRFPTLIVCGFMVLAGIQSFFTGMMLQVLAAKDRRDFEYKLNRTYHEKQQLLKEDL